MKSPIYFLLLLLTVTTFASEEELHTFTRADGKTGKDRIVKYNFEEQIITLENSGKIAFDLLSEADQEYVLHWNQVQGFTSSFRFKMELTPRDWARLRPPTLNTTPYLLDAFQMQGKKTPMHLLEMHNEYIENNALNLRAEGYEITIKNSNFFPIKNLKVESRIYYEQEKYITDGDIFDSPKKLFTETETIRKSRIKEEALPSIAVREEIVLYSECAIMAEEQLNREKRQTNGENNTDDSTFNYDWDDHNRKRRGKVIGLWVRVGITGLDGEMIWREKITPDSLKDKVTWDGTFLDDEKEQE